MPSHLLPSTHEPLDAPRPWLRVVAVLLHLLFLGVLLFLGSFAPPVQVPIDITMVTPNQVKALEQAAQKGETLKAPEPEEEELPEVGEPPPPEPVPAVVTPPAPAPPVPTPPPPPPPPPKPTPAVAPKIEPPKPKPPKPEPKPTPPPPPEPPKLTKEQERAKKIEEMRRSLDKTKARRPIPTLKPGTLPRTSSRDIEKKLMAGVSNPTVTARFSPGATSGGGNTGGFFGALKAELDSRWNQPTQIAAGPRVLVKLVILSDGTVTVASVARASGVPAMDSSIRQLLAGLRNVRSTPRQFGLTASRIEVEVEFILE